MTDDNANDPRALILDDVHIRLDGRTLVHVSTTIGPGDICSIMGPSGSGKSTLLAYLSGFLDSAFQATGRVVQGGRDLTGLAPHQRRLGLLLQDPLLFPHMSVGQNLLFAVPAGAGDRRQREAIAAKALDDAGLSGFFHRDPATLSGGQKARVALMRVLVSEPGALLLDEPFSRLDADRREKIRQFVFAKARQRRLPVLLVTHDEADAASAGGEVFVIAA